MSSPLTRRIRKPWNPVDAETFLVLLRKRASLDQFLAAFPDRHISSIHGRAKRLKKQHELTWTLRTAARRGHRQRIVPVNRQTEELPTTRMASYRLTPEMVQAWQLGERVSVKHFHHFKEEGV